jgi:ABC-type lipoprotein release transport system permease subunit
MGKDSDFRFGHDQAGGLVKGLAFRIEVRTGEGRAAGKKQGETHPQRRALPFPSVISVQATVTALIFSASWGILFGVFPAWKAAKLHPVEALRYE